ncbi:MAG: methionine transporter permease [Firmicutes bacterium]|nr:methionine transporter permease [Bacillota bacterium]
MREYTWAEIANKIMIPSFFDTIWMLSLAVFLAGFLGFALAILMFITNKNGLRPNDKAYSILNTMVSMIRAFPFVILIVAIIPLTRLITGTTIGHIAALVPLTVAATPFMARMFENSLKEVKPGLVVAARSFGATDWQIIRKIVLPEVLPSLISAGTMSVIQVLNMTTIAGTMGAGGLGASALTYGYQSFNYNVMYSVVAVIGILVLIIQVFGDFLYKKIK